jgi:DNA replication protein DnaC
MIFKTPEQIGLDVLMATQTKNVIMEQIEEKRRKEEVARERAMRVKEYMYHSNLPYRVVKLVPFVAKDGRVSVNQTAIFSKIREEWNEFMKAKSVIFYGGYGLGKTYTSIGLACHFIKNNRATKFIRSNEYVERVTRFEDMSFFKNASILVLDEVGDQSVDSRYVTHIRELLIHRDAMRLKTIMTTNMNIGDLPRYLGGRVWDRVLSSLYLVDFGNGKSLRGM